MIREQSVCAPVTLFPGREPLQSAGGGLPPLLPVALVASQQGHMAPHLYGFQPIHGSTLEFKGKGVVFRTANGDFAEWRRRDPLAREFEEGDIIGVDSAGLLTLQTVGMKQVGVISRRAAVEGSCPAADEQHLFDLVAYSGHVPVKLRGHCRPGDIIIPSGLADGTAMSQDSPHSRCVAFKKTQKLGRALAGTSTSEPEDLELLPLPAESADNDAWSLVLISVINPVDTVSRPIRSVVTTILAGVFGILVCWALIASLVHTDSDHQNPAHAAL